jgi:hypothetical protein
MSNFNLFVLLIVFGVLVLACIGAGTFLLWHHLRTRGLREQFGPEYDRALERTGSRKAGEAELLERRRRHRTLELRTLDSTQLSEFQQRWTDVQREFVEDPTHAVRNADTLVVDVMSARGYPTNDLDQRADDLSVDHPHIAQHYRDARQIAKADKRGNASTEDLRQAVTAYRALLEELLTDKKGDVDLGGRRGGRGRRGSHNSDRADGRDGGRLNGQDPDRRDRRIEARDGGRTDGRLDDRVDGRHRDSGRVDDPRDYDRARDHDRDNGARDDVRGGLRDNPGTERETRA